MPDCLCYIICYIASFQARPSLTRVCTAVDDGEYILGCRPGRGFRAVPYIIYKLQLNPTLITNDVNNRVRNGHFVPHQPRQKFNWWTKKLLTTGSRQSRGGIYTVKPSSIKLHLTFKCTQWPSGKRRKTFVRHLTSFRALKERETKCPITEPIRVLFLIKLRGENATSLSIYRKISGRCNLE